MDESKANILSDWIERSAISKTFHLFEAWTPVHLIQIFIMDIWKGFKLNHLQLDVLNVDSGILKVMVWKSAFWE
jgi:hypothetical protein